MDYQSYEDYMRSVLGYQSIPSNIYVDTYSSPRNNYFYDFPQINTNMIQQREDELNDLYPEIYRIVYPMVCKVCNQNQHRTITRDILEQMTEEIYSNIEQDERQNTNTTRIPLKNGDVRNPNSKEPELRSEKRQGNFLLRDLIKILIIKEFLRKRRIPQRPQYGMPPGRPPFMQRTYNDYEYY